MNTKNRQVIENLKKHFEFLTGLESRHYLHDGNRLAMQYLRLENII